MDTTYRKQRTITVKRNRLFNDIEILSQEFSEAGLSGDNVRRSDRVSTDLLDANGNHIMTRLCDHRANDVRKLFVRFIGATTATTATDSKEGDMYTYVLWLPNDAEDALLTPMADLIHDYIVNGALADWYNNLGVAGGEKLAAKAKDDLAELKDLIYHRPMP